MAIFFPYTTPTNLNTSLIFNSTNFIVNQNFFCQNQLQTSNSRAAGTLELCLGIPAVLIEFMMLLGAH